ncbi:MAG: hypothetical protein IT428_06995 [Planctomycetaceae bacterium]|nr:hypothetical protein [Planctomycetaceae bacterium]
MTNARFFAEVVDALRSEKPKRIDVVRTLVEGETTTIKPTPGDLTHRKVQPYPAAGLQDCD